MSTKNKKGTHKKSKLQKLNEKYLRQYKSWNKIHCPALKRDVHFTGKGWAHLQREKWRTRSEKEERLKLLPLARHILKVTTTFQEQRIQNYHQTKHLHYGFTAIVGGIKVSVVVIEDKGRLDFLSVFKGKIPV